MFISMSITDLMDDVSWTIGELESLTDFEEDDDNLDTILSNLTAGAYFTENIAASFRGERISDVQQYYQDGPSNEETDTPEDYVLHQYIIPAIIGNVNMVVDGDKVLGRVILMHKTLAVEVT
jgi:hypothetical protein